MRILLISTQFPLPARDGASLRVLNLLRQLARHHRVTLLSLTDRDPSRGEVAELERVCRVRIIRHRRSRLRRAWDLVASFFWREPYLVRIYRSRALAEAVRELAARTDLVQAEFPYGGQYLLSLGPDQPVVLDQHNVESTIISANAAFETNPFRRLFFRVQARKMARYEQSLCKQVDLVLATSSQDETTLSPYCQRTVVIPNGIHAAEWDAKPSAGGKPGQVTFTGLMSYVANVDAMNYFCKEIWPRVEAADRHLWIVGKGAGPKTAELAGDRITVTGEVPDVKPYLERTSVFVAPLRIGSGTRIKILDAMAHGLPVISTSIGCMGIDVRHGENILIADDPRQFASALDFLLGSPEERRRLGRAGFELVRNLYSWDAIGSQLHLAYSTWQSALSAR